MSRDSELFSMEAAYQSLRGLPSGEWMRALNYLADRLASDDRAAHISKLEEPPAPTQFINEGEMACPYEDADDLVRDNADTLVPFEVNGVAVVSQRFAVMVPIASGEDEDGDPIHDGDEIMWFDTREAADAYVADAIATTEPA